MKVNYTLKVTFEQKKRWLFTTNHNRVERTQLFGKNKRMNSTTLSDTKRGTTKYVLIILNFLIGVLVLIPLFIYLNNGSVTVYYYGVDCTDIAHILIFVDAVLLVVFTYWKWVIHSREEGRSMPKLFLLVTQTTLHGFGAMRAPSIYHMHYNTMNNNKNGYSPFKGILIEHNWTTEQITEKLKKEIEALSEVVKLSLAERKQVLNEGLEQGRLEEALKFVKLRIEEIDNSRRKPNEPEVVKANEATIGWSEWFYTNTKLVKDTIIWSFGSNGYYIGYAVLAVILGAGAYYYSTNKIIEAVSHTNKGVESVIKADKDLLNSIEKVKDATTLISNKIDKLESKVTKDLITQHQINDKIFNVIGSETLVKKLSNSKEELELLSEKIVNTPSINMNSGETLVKKSILSLVDEVNENLTKASMNNTSQIMTIKDSVNSVIKSLKEQESDRQISNQTIWECIQKIANKLQKLSSEHENYVKKVEQLTARNVNMNIGKFIQKTAEEFSKN